MFIGYTPYITEEKVSEKDVEGRRDGISKN
jgi:hypothetical protein